MSRTQTMDPSDQRLAADVAVFERALDGAADLAEMSWAARRMLVTAAALFHRNGAAATSVRDITTACGLSPAALYTHFPGKDDLLYRLVLHGHVAMQTRVRDALAAASPQPLPRLAAFVHAYVEGHLERPELAQVVRREYLHLSEQRRTEIVTRRRRIRAQLSTLIRAGIADGALQRLPDAGHTALTIMVLDMCSRTSEWYDPARPGHIDRVAERYVAGALRLCGAS